MSPLPDEAGDVSLAIANSCADLYVRQRVSL